MGHNKIRHSPPNLTIAGHAVRHAACLIEHGCNISTGDLCHQMTAILATLVGMSDVATQRPDSINLSWLRQIKYVYDALIDWIRHPDNPHRSHIRIIPSHKLPPDIQIVVGGNAQETRSTIGSLKEMLSVIADSPVRLKAISARDCLPSHTLILPFPDEWDQDVRSAMKNSFDRVFADPNTERMYAKVHGGHRICCGTQETGSVGKVNTVLQCGRCGAVKGCDFFAEYPARQNCRGCGLVGHNYGSCKTRSSGTHVATALATILDQCKQCRQEARDIHKTLINVHHIIWGMCYRIWKYGWGVEEDMCSVLIKETKSGTVRVRGPDRLHLLSLMRMYNYTVAQVLKVNWIGADIRVVHDMPASLGEKEYEYFGMDFLRAFRVLDRRSSTVHLPGIEIGTQTGPMSPSAAGGVHVCHRQEIDIPVMQQVLPDLSQLVRSAILTLSTTRTIYPSTMGSYDIGGVGYLYGE